MWGLDPCFGDSTARELGGFPPVCVGVSARESLHASSRAQGCVWGVHSALAHARCMRALSAHPVHAPCTLVHTSFMLFSQVPRTLHLHAPCMLLLNTHGLCTLQAHANADTLFLQMPCTLTCMPHAHTMHAFSTCSMSTISTQSVLCVCSLDMLYAWPLAC